jgi:hypothetical protein
LISQRTDGKFLPLASRLLNFAFFQDSPNIKETKESIEVVEANITSNGVGDIAILLHHY